jgi:hypothetical protein
VLRCGRLAKSPASRCAARLNFGTFDRVTQRAGKRDGANEVGINDDDGHGHAGGDEGVGVVELAAAIGRHSSVGRRRRFRS